MKFKDRQDVLIRPNFVEDTYEDATAWHVGIVLGSIGYMQGEQWYEVHYLTDGTGGITATRSESQLRAFMVDADVDTLVSL